MNKTVLIIITVALAVGIGMIFFGESENNSGSAGTQPVNNVEIRDGIQYVTINVKAGYSPRASFAQANIPTKLVMKTSGTYDCSAALVIRSIGYETILPQTGEEIINVGTPRAGTLQGLCSMGMYSFTVDFK